MNTTHTLRIASRLRIAACILGSRLAAGCARSSPQRRSRLRHARRKPSRPSSRPSRSTTCRACRHCSDPAAKSCCNRATPCRTRAIASGFLAAYKAKHALTDDGADRKILVVGEQDWPMPIPIVKRDGKWVFDGEAGIDETDLPPRRRATSSAPSTCAAAS